MNSKDASLVAPALLAYAESSMRVFATETMTHMIKSATKHKRSIAGTLISLRDALTASPLLPPPPPSAGAAAAAAAHAAHPVAVAARLRVLRAATGEMVAAAGGEAKSLFNRSADFSPTSLKELNAAERAARAHQLALSASDVRTELTNLSHLWLREAHLEMAALEPHPGGGGGGVGSQASSSHAPQFPATLSLPWILAGTKSAHPTQAQPP